MNRRTLPSYQRGKTNKQTYASYVLQSDMTDDEKADAIALNRGSRIFTFHPKK